MSAVRLFCRNEKAQEASHIERPIRADALVISLFKEGKVLVFFAARTRLRGRRRLGREEILVRLRLLPSRILEIRRMAAPRHICGFTQRPPCDCYSTGKFLVLPNKHRKDSPKQQIHRRRNTGLGRPVKHVFAQPLLVCRVLHDSHTLLHLPFYPFLHPSNLALFILLLPAIPLPASRYPWALLGQILATLVDCPFLEGRYQ